MSLIGEHWKYKVLNNCNYNELTSWDICKIPKRTNVGMFIEEAVDEDNIVTDDTAHRKLNIMDQKRSKWNVKTMGSGVERPVVARRISLVKSVRTRI